MSWIKFYWNRGKSLVRIGKLTYCWDGIYGIQFGSVFIGIIIGDRDA